MWSDIHKADEKLFTTQDILAWEPPKVRHIIWDGVLNVGSKMEIFGGEGSWKSSLALNLAYSVATGRRWLGFKTSPANVLYIAGERGKEAVRARIERYCQGTASIYIARPGDAPNKEDRVHQLAYPPNVVLRYVDDIQHFDSHAGSESLRKMINLMIQHFPSMPTLVIVDPLYKVFGHDLTSQTDFNEFATHMDLILSEYNKPDEKTKFERQMGLVVIHHSRKESVDKDGNLVRHGANESFGPREKEWWFDTVFSSNLIESDKTKTQIKVELEKYGNAEKQLPEYFRIRWDRDTLHPQILERKMPSLPEDELESRGQSLLEKLEL